MSRLTTKLVLAALFCLTALSSSAQLSAQRHTGHFRQRPGNRQAGLQQVVQHLAPVIQQQRHQHRSPGFQRPANPHQTQFCRSTGLPLPIQPQPIYVQPVHSHPMYSQPVYSQPQPVVVHSTTTQPAKPPTAAELARAYTSEAKSLFLRGDYAAAKSKLNEVVKRADKDADAYQFRSLVSFAAGQYKEAAADAYDAMSLGNSWTTPVLKSLYGEQLTPYKSQMAALQHALQTEPSMPGHFLMAYHHAVNEEWEQSKTQLQMVLKLQANEPLSTKLLAAVDAKLVAQAETASR